MKINSNKLLLTLCIGTAASITLLTGCQSDSSRSAGRKWDDRSISRHVDGDLKHDPLYKYEGVKIETYDAIVQLSGFVDTNEQRVRAGEIASHVDGVQKVVNSLTLKPGNVAGVSPTGSPTGQRQDPPPTPAAPVVTTPP